MLIYHPAFDAYHCVFRMLLLADKILDLETDKAKLLDFYILFPGMVKNMRLPDSLKNLRSQAKKAVNVYRDPVSEVSTFREMRHIQDAALKCIAASGLIDLERYEAGYVTRTQLPTNLVLKTMQENFLNSNQPIITEILTGLSSIPLLGNDGLKHRSQLMEHRYDYV
jgi:hypothetical protein